jgi:hypothetical protein
VFLCILKGVKSSGKVRLGRLGAKMQWLGRKWALAKAEKMIEFT